MRLLFVHKHFPGQFLNLALAFAAHPDNEVVFMSTEQGFAVQGIKSVQFEPARSSSPPTHHYIQPFEDAVLLGQAAYRAASSLRKEGFIPDLIYAHAGHGPGLYMKDIYPDTPLIGQFEWFYHPDNSNSDFLCLKEVTEDEALRLRTKNADLLLELVQCDYGICPTSFQMDQFPSEFHGKLQVIHEGIDTSFFSPARRGELTLGDLLLGEDAEIVTYATHGLEPYRGFPQFMRTLNMLQAQRPRMHAVIAGDDSVYFGDPRSDGKSWKNAMLEELPSLDLSRIHFTGPLTIQDYRRLLRASHAHIFLIAPFVLSWSLLEAMSTGCTIIGSATEPVHEMIEDGRTGLLADFFDPSRLAARIGEALDDKAGAERLGRAARDFMVEHYDLRSVLPSHFRLASHVLGYDVTSERSAETGAPMARSA